MEAETSLLLNVWLIVLTTILGLVAHFAKKVYEIRAGIEDLKARAKVTLGWYLKANPYLAVLSLIGAFMGCLMLYSMDSLNAIGSFGVGWMANSALEAVNSRTKTMLQA